MLTDEQVENWRKVLLGMIGVRALRMTKEEIQAYRDWMQEQANELDVELKTEIGNLEKPENRIKGI